MTLIGIIKSFWSDGKAKSKLDKELIRSSLLVCEAINNQNDEEIINSLAYFEFLSKQLRNKYEWNSKIHCEVHKLENVHVYGRSAES